MNDIIILVVTRKAFGVNVDFLKYAHRHSVV